MKNPVAEVQQKNVETETPSKELTVRDRDIVMVITTVVAIIIYFLFLDFHESRNVETPPHLANGVINGLIVQYSLYFFLRRPALKKKEAAK